MKMLIFIICSLLVTPALASTEDQTSILMRERPTDSQLQTAISTLYKAINTEKMKNKDRYILQARKLINVQQVTRIFPGAVFVDGIKQFENGEDSAYDFRVTCFKGEVKDVENLINLSLEQGFWSGDEEAIESAKVNEKNITLQIHDRPNDEKFEVEISPCQ